MKTPVEAKPDLWRKARRARRRILFLGMRTVLRGIGFDRIAVLGRITGILQYHFDRKQRLRIEHDMALALGLSLAEVAPLLREAYRVNNTAVLEILSMFDRRLNEKVLAAHCEVTGLEHLRAAMAGGHGAILLATHAGNAAQVVVKLASAGWAVSVVYREAHMMSAGFLQVGLERYGIEGILANTGLRAYGQMLAALRQGRIVFIMMDQGVRFAKDGLMQRFLGKDIAMPTGPAQLARTASAPLLPVATVGAHPSWRFEVGPPVPLGRDALEADVQTLVQLTERQIVLYPQLWSWHHRRWRKLPYRHAEQGAKTSVVPKAPDSGPSKTADAIGSERSSP